MKIYTAIGYCEDRGHNDEHEIMFITDGLSYAAYGSSSTDDCSGAVRNGDKFFVVCGQRIKTGPQQGSACLGSATFDVSQAPQIGRDWHDQTEDVLSSLTLAMCARVPDLMD